MPKKTLIGQISSNKMKSTVIVKVELTKVHPKYQKRYKVHKKYAAAAEGDYAIGDKVVIEESKPLSKSKRWRVIQKLS